MTQTEVEEIVHAELANQPTQPGVDTGLTSEDAEQIARGVVASIPPKSDPVEYTKFFVENAISRYETHGLDTTLAYYNRNESIDGQWYVFIFDEDDLVIGHPDPARIGLDLKGWLGTDANGYTFGADMLSATEDGKWVSYVYQNPESGAIDSGEFDSLELKNSWVVKHDGLLFGSGWYVNADEFTPSLVNAAVDKFRSAGLAATVEYFTGPESVYSGLTATIEYYNSTDTIDGDWLALIADDSGEIVSAFDLAMMGKHLGDLFGVAAVDLSEATEQGNWVITEDVRLWAVNSDGMTFVSGWYSGSDGSN